MTGPAGAQRLPARAIRFARRRPTALGLAALLLLALIGYGHLLTPGETPYSPHSDIVTQHLATKQVLYDSVSEGRGLPFWRSDQLAGYPAFSNPQALYTYPGHALFWLTEPAAAMGPTLWLHFALAALVFYAVAAALGLGPWPRLFVAAAGLFSFKLIIATYAGWLPVLPAIVSFPLLIVCTVRLFERPGLGRALALAAVGALCLHGGHLQLVYYAALLLAVFAVARAVRAVRDRELAPFGKTAGWTAASALLAAGLSAYLLVPQLAELDLLSRTEVPYASFLMGHDLSWRHLWTLLYPEALGTPLTGSYEPIELWESVAYFGVAPLALVVAAIALRPRGYPVVALATGFAVSLALAFDTPVLRALHAVVPGFDLFRGPGRFTFITAFCGLALAGIGLQAIGDRLRDRSRWRAAIAGALTLAVAVEGTIYARRYLEMRPVDEVLPSPAYRAALRADDPGARVAPLARPTINYGWAASLDLQLVTGYDPAHYRHYADYFQLLQYGKLGDAAPGNWLDLMGIARTDLLDALDVRFIASPQPLQLPADRFPPAGYFPAQPMFLFYQGFVNADVAVYGNRGARGRAFWAGEILRVASYEEMIAAVIGNRLDRVTVILDPAADPAIAPAGAGRVNVRRAIPGELLIETNSPAPGYLVVSEPWHPGWRASIDGAEARIARADVALQAVPVPAGDHVVHLAFRPLGWHFGIGTSAACALCYLALLGWWVRVRRGSRSTGVVES